MKNIFAIIISALLSGCRNNPCIPERIVVGANENVLSVRVFTDPVPELEGIPVKADKLHTVRFLPDGTRYDSWWKNGLNTGVGTTGIIKQRGFPTIGITDQSYVDGATLTQILAVGA